MLTVFSFLCQLTLGMNTAHDQNARLAAAAAADLPDCGSPVVYITSHVPSLLLSIAPESVVHDNACGRGFVTLTLLPAGRLL